jgi:hypothetical protein
VIQIGDSANHEACQLPRLTGIEAQPLPSQGRYVPNPIELYGSIGRLFESRLNEWNNCYQMPTNTKANFLGYGISQACSCHLEFVATKTGKN